MDVDYADQKYRRLEVDPQFTAGLSVEIVRSFRKKIWFVRQTMDERDMAAMRGLNFERLRPPRDHEWSIRLNKQWRLIFEIVAGEQGKTIMVNGIEDYH
jgi:proteic killer suppression protein